MIFIKTFFHIFWAKYRNVFLLSAENWWANVHTNINFKFIWINVKNYFIMEMKEKDIINAQRTLVYLKENFSRWQMYEYYLCYLLQLLSMVTIGSVSFTFLGYLWWTKFFKHAECIIEVARTLNFLYKFHNRSKHEVETAAICILQQIMLYNHNEHNKVVPLADSFKLYMLTNHTKQTFIRIAKHILLFNKQVGELNLIFKTFCWNIFSCKLSYLFLIILRFAEYF